jgi:hypothetical protein
MIFLQKWILFAVIASIFLLSCKTEELDKPDLNPSDTSIEQETIDEIIAVDEITDIPAELNEFDETPDIAETYQIPEGCNPLDAEWDCLVPFPSDYFLAEDKSMQNGKRVVIPENALNLREDNLPVDFFKIHPADGFSHLSQILAVFPAGIDSSNLVFHTGDVFASLNNNSPTLIIEADSGNTILHFAELDPNAENDSRRALILRPLVRLKNNTRYIAAIHNLHDHDGKLIEPPEGFSRILTGKTQGSEVLEKLAVRYEKEIFPIIEKAGLKRDDLQLAWDFTTGTESNITHDMIDIRNTVINLFKNKPPEITITNVEDNYSSSILRRIDGTVRVSLFTEKPEPDSLLNRDEKGKVASNGETDVPFLILIPASLADFAPEDKPARLVQYGHGFFQKYDNLGELGNLYKLMNDAKIILITTDWCGMTKDDAPSVLMNIVDNPSRSLVFTDRIHQAMANLIAISYAAKTTLVNEPSMKISGKTVYDPEHIYFYGISEGHILGGTYIALSPRIDRAVLGSGCAGLSFIMPRSRSFLPFFVLLQKLMPDPLNLQKFMSLTQITFDRIDPVTYVSHILENTYTESPEFRKVLMHGGIGDAQVPNLATQLHARALGLKHLKPVSRDIPGLEQVNSPYDGSALVEFDFGINPLPGILASPPQEENPVHEGVRKLDAVNKQIDMFFNPDGKIVQTCDGVCDPE